MAAVSPKPAAKCPERGSAATAKALDSVQGRSGSACVAGASGLAEAHFKLKEWDCRTAGNG